MARQTLNAVTALGDYSFNLDGITLTEKANMRLLSIGFSPSDSSRVADALSATLSLELPATGSRSIAQLSDSANTDSAGRTLLGLQREQLWLLSSSHDEKSVPSHVGSADAPIWITDQSDAWVVLDVSGSRSSEVLERLCPLDLNSENFTDTSVARTAFEHMSVIILKISETQFYLLTPRSSVQSFAHAVTHAATHVVNELEVRA